MYAGAASLNELSRFVFFYLRNVFVRDFNILEPLPNLFLAIYVVIRLWFSIGLWLSPRFFDSGLTLPAAGKSYLLFKNNFFKLVLTKPFSHHSRQKGLKSLDIWGFFLKLSHPCWNFNRPLVNFSLGTSKKKLVWQTTDTV